MCCPKNFLVRQNLFWRTLISANTCLAFLQSRFHTFVTGYQDPRVCNRCFFRNLLLPEFQRSFLRPACERTRKPLGTHCPNIHPLRRLDNIAGFRNMDSYFFSLVVLFHCFNYFFCCCCYLFLLSPLLLKQNKIKTNKQTNRISS